MQLNNLILNIWNLFLNIWNICKSKFLSIIFQSLLSAWLDNAYFAYKLIHFSCNFNLRLHELHNLRLHNLGFEVLIQCFRFFFVFFILHKVKILWWLLFLHLLNLKYLYCCRPFLFALSFDRFEICKNVFQPIFADNFESAQICSLIILSFFFLF